MIAKKSMKRPDTLKIFSYNLVCGILVLTLQVAIKFWHSNVGDASIVEQSCPQFPTFFFSIWCDIWHSMHFFLIELL